MNGGMGGVVYKKKKKKINKIENTLCNNVTELNLYLFEQHLQLYPQKILHLGFV